MRGLMMDTQLTIGRSDVSGSGPSPMTTKCFTVGMSFACGSSPATSDSSTKSTRSAAWFTM